jgi:hypothetical protein
MPRETSLERSSLIFCTSRLRRLARLQSLQRDRLARRCFETRTDRGWTGERPHSGISLHLQSSASPQRIAVRCNSISGAWGLRCALPQSIQQRFNIWWKLFGDDIRRTFSHHFADLLDDGVGSLALRGHADNIGITPALIGADEEDLT